MRRIANTVWPLLPVALMQSINALAANADTIWYGGPIVTVNEPAKNSDEIAATLLAAAKARHLKPGELFLGYGYDENLMPKGQPLSRDALDKAFPDNPVAIIHVSMHGAVLNSRAFEKFGYKDGMPSSSISTRSSRAIPLRPSASTTTT